MKHASTGKTAKYSPDNPLPSFPNFRHSRCDCPIWTVTPDTIVATGISGKSSTSLPAAPTDSAERFGSNASCRPGLNIVLTYLFERCKPAADTAHGKEGPGPTARSRMCLRKLARERAVAVFGSNMHRTISNQCRGLLAKLAGLRAAARRGADAPSGTRPLRSIHCIELEDRVLLSASPVGSEAACRHHRGPRPAGAQPAGRGQRCPRQFRRHLGQHRQQRGCFAQLYNAAGQSQGNAIQVNTTTNGDQASPAVAMSSSGSFVVTWADDSSGSWEIMAQRYDASGNAQGSSFVVNTDSGAQQYPDIAMDAAGNFVITWTDNSSRARTPASAQGI